MSARLVPLDRAEEIPLDRDHLLVGREPRCDVRIASPWVSRHHCCLSPCRGEVLVCDLGSTNGTWINGRRVERGVLQPGDILSIARFRYHLEIRRVE
jgi:pSer/pThr/pTyr-binding forkhead associated (FHA) protein